MYAYSMHTKHAYTRVRIILTVRIPSMRTRGVRIKLEYANELAVYIIITLYIYI